MLLPRNNESYGPALLRLDESPQHLQVQDFIFVVMYSFYMYVHPMFLYFIVDILFIPFYVAHVSA